tara:strand:+ start:9060 stop:9473 length:414 start_codon:yes stop_codon:yes gene_type:complete
MEKIFSKKDNNLLLHIVNRKDNIMNRTNLSEDNAYLQVSTLNINTTKKFKPHKHRFLERTTTRTQECWIIIQGKIKATYYDIDDKIITEKILEPGDCSITYNGAHNIDILEDNTLMYEIKNGPYMGNDRDIEYILQN